MLEADRLVQEERVAFLIGDMNMELTAVEGNVVRPFKVLQCSSLADTGVQDENFGFGNPNFISAQGSFVEPGDAAAIILENFRMKQVVVLSEDTLECQSMIRAFMRNSVTASWQFGMSPIDPADNTYRTWSRSIKYARSEVVWWYNVGHTVIITLYLMRP
ncbi:hypothetical protein HK102_006326 [Quaeritorhiza haematococci]|nr:hypothetical protein HK102_006326 [Quaeritorhiza haematococci]